MKKTVPLKNGLFTLLILEAVMITIVTIFILLQLYKLYTNLVYSEAAEIVNLQAIITDAKFSEIENLSFEMLSNPDIQSNLRKYSDSPDSFEAYQATNDLYTQLFTRWIMNKNIISISFVFLNGRRVDTGYQSHTDWSESNLQAIISDAALKDGLSGWTANHAGDNIITHYRLLKDISGNRFKPLGTLIINIDAGYFLSHNPVNYSSKYQPDLLCIAGEQILNRNPLQSNPSAILNLIDTSIPYQLVTLNHQPYFMAGKNLTVTGWYLVYLLSSRDLLSNINRMNIIYCLILLLLAVVIIIVGYAFANAITRPITRLTTAMKLVETGDYSFVHQNQASEPHPLITEVIHLTKGFSQMIGKIDHLIREVYMKQLMIAEMKYKMLQQQINPHFLYNTLDTINWKAVQIKNRDISVMVRALSKMIRGSIKGPDIITLREDLSFVEDYIRIQKIRFEERLQFTQQISEPALSCRIPRLTLQPIVENCIIHNLEKHKGICQIALFTSSVNGQLKISVEDNGRGIKQELINKVLHGEVKGTNNSIGLWNIDQRIKMAFGPDFGICIQNKEPTGTRVTVSIPEQGGFDENTFNR